MKKKQFIVLAFATALLTARSSEFADVVVDYDPGIGYVAGFTNAEACLGEPSRNNPFGDPTDPFDPPYGKQQIVSIGAGGSLTVNWPLEAVNHGSFDVYITLVSPSEAGRAPAIGPAVHIAVADRKTLLPDGQTGSLLDYVRREYDSLVLKPNRSYGGQGVVIGHGLPRAEWESALERALREQPPATHRAP